MAIVALVFGAMALAGPANAKDDKPDKPDNPGNSQNAPGHDEDGLPPGQDDDFVPPGQQDRPNTEKKIWICHADANNGNGNTNLGVEGPDGLGTGGEAGVGFNLIYISVNAWQNSHDKLHENDYPASGAEIAQGFCGTQTQYSSVTVCVATGPSAYGMATFEGEVGTPQSTWTSNGKAMSTFTVVDAALCNPVKPTSASVEYCVATGPSAYALMTFTGMSNTAEATWVNGTQPLSAFTKVDRTLCMTPEQAAAIDAAIAELEPEAVAPVLPATVAEETAAVPAPATVPAAVPAGDGSSVPQVPMALFAALALATVGAVTSAFRMATSR
jgi:hypothetical protein